MILSVNLVSYGMAARPTYYFAILWPSPANNVGKGTVFLDCPFVSFICPFVRPFIWSVIVTRISHGWLE